MELIALVGFIALPIIALASPLETRQTNASCSTGPVQCCQTMYASDSIEGSTFLKMHSALNGEDYDGVGSPGAVGVGCSPLIGSVCNEDPTCCSAYGLIAIGCIVIDLNL